MHRINFILVLLHQSWVYYIINSFYNWTCFGVVRILGVTSLFLQQVLLCLIGFMVCLNCSSPEDNRSLQCFKLNYRCCKVCSEKDCEKGLFPPWRFVQGSYVCPSCPVCAGNGPPPCSSRGADRGADPVATAVPGLPTVVPVLPAVSCTCSCAQRLLFSRDWGWWLQHRASASELR